MSMENYYDSKLLWVQELLSAKLLKKTCQPEYQMRVLSCQADSRKEVLESMEALYVTHELVDDPKCYNLKTGGMGARKAGLILKKLKRK
jgi:hypothetical protein